MRVFLRILAGLAVLHIAAGAVPAQPPGRTISPDRPALVTVQKGGYTVNELSNIHEFSKTRWNTPPRRPGIHLATPLGRVEIHSYEILRQYVPGDVVPVIENAFIRADKILAGLNFPEQVRAADYNWQLFAQDSRADGTASGFMSSERCHSAWMGPPANVFIAADRLTNRCGTGHIHGTGEVQAVLEQTLVHEIGHAVEFQMMGKGFGRRQRWHSEGFASWFETLPEASGNPRDREKAYSEALTAFEAEWNPALFNGSRDDYSRSYAMIATLADRYSPVKLFEIYQRMGRSDIRFEEAVQREVGWDMPRWLAETKMFLGEKVTESLYVDVLLANRAKPEPSEVPAKEEKWDAINLLPDFNVEIE